MSPHHGRTSISNKMTSLNMIWRSPPSTSRYLSVPRASGGRATRRNEREQRVDFNKPVRFVVFRRLGRGGSSLPVLHADSKVIDPFIKQCRGRNTVQAGNVCEASQSSGRSCAMVEHPWTVRIIIRGNQGGHGDKQGCQ